MARVTDTRAQVRILADQLAAAGTQPTPTLIKKMLGRGSPNTIVSELRAWAKDREARNPTEDNQKPIPQSTPTAEALTRIGLKEIAELVKSTVSAANTISEAVRRIEQTALRQEELSSALNTIASTLASIENTVSTDRQWMQQELDKAYERYEAVQRHALRSIDSAREEARKAKERLRDIESSSLTRESIFKSQIDELRLLVSNLKGKLEERGEDASSIVVPSVREPAPIPKPTIPVAEERPLNLLHYEVPDFFPLDEEDGE